MKIINLVLVVALVFLVGCTRRYDVRIEMQGGVPPDIESRQIMLNELEEDEELKLPVHCYQCVFITVTADVPKQIDAGAELSPQLPLIP